MLNMNNMRMRQALGNVIRNATQHSESGGKIDVSATIESDKFVKIREERPLPAP
ncbi:MAG: ATP-binding protein [Chloroflexi bacterium]|nr:MAG: ATP-binding protein [Chloroflexota bacterium]